jgi:hypothetical protein
VNEILLGINNYFESQPDLTREFPGGIWLVTVPNTVEREYPYVVVNATDTPFYTFTEELAEFRISFFIHSNDPNGHRMIVLRDLLSDNYDENLFEVDGWSVKMFRREQSQEIQELEDDWVTTLQYRCVAEECEV